MNLDVKTLVIIRDATRALIDHGAGHTRESFEADRKTRSAILFEIVIQGEGVKRLSPNFRDRNPEDLGPRLLECEIVSFTRSTPLISILPGRSSKFTGQPYWANSTGSSRRSPAPDGRIPIP